MYTPVIIEPIAGFEPRIYVEDASHETNDMIPDLYVFTHLDRKHIRVFHSLQDFTQWVANNNVQFTKVRCLGSGACLF